MSAPARYEAGDTRLFTAAYSSAPSTPYLAFYIGSLSTTSGTTLTLVSCATAAVSDTTHFYRYFTLPNTEAFLTYEWVGSFANGPVVVRGLLKVIKTVPG